ncbi:hypothetical protein ACTTAI_19360 [Rhodobacter capsulatus]|uniref:hypothetical protein n=1 Tax=Rhodobacter capsulatus TaxID=1061 RepID=UPI0040269DDC
MIAVSDIYLSGAQVNDLLTAHGIVVDAPAFCVMPISRRMALIPMMVDSHDFAVRGLLCALENGLKPRQYFERRSIDARVFQNAPEFDQPMNKIDFIVAYQSHLALAAAAERTVFLHDLQRWIGQPKGRTALVDIGWGLTTIRAIDLLIGDDFKGYFLGKQVTGYHRPGLRGYIFDHDDAQDTEARLKGGLELLELVFSDTRPAFSRLDVQSGKLALRSDTEGLMDMSRNLAIMDVRRGVLDFLRDFRPVFEAVTAEDLKSHILPELLGLLNAPQVREYRALAQVPHARGMGHRSWGTLGDFWKPVL